MDEIDPDTTIGVYAGSDADMIQEFDEYFQRSAGTYSRSREIKNAMKLYLQVQRTLDEFEYELDERAVRMMVAEGMRLKDRQDRESLD